MSTIGEARMLRSELRKVRAEIAAEENVELRSRLEVEASVIERELRATWAQARQEAREDEDYERRHGSGL